MSKQILNKPGQPVTFIRGVLLSIIVSGILVVLPAHAEGFWNGRQLMQEVHRRHEQYPYVFEEHSMVMVDSMGQRDSRHARRYSRVEPDGEVKLLYIFDSPPEVKGVTLLASVNHGGEKTAVIYLPAMGGRFLESTGTGSDGNFLGTDFSVESLIAESLSDYDYVRHENIVINDIEYFVIDVYAAGESITENQPLRRHFIRQDNFYLMRTDYFDAHGRLHKQLTHFDLKQMDDEMWRPGIILMDDKKLDHQSIIKVNRRIFSVDYVPVDMFNREWILANNPPLVPEPEDDSNDIADNGTGNIDSDPKLPMAGKPGRLQ